MDRRSPTKGPKLIIWLLSLALALLSAGSVSSALAAGPGQSPPYDESEAYAIDRMLMCPICAGQTIDQSQSALAGQMRLLVREMLAQGATRQEVLGFFADRYGQKVLAAPPKSGFNLLAWVLPAVGVVAALLAGMVVIRAMTSTSRGGEVPTEPPLEEGLEPYLEAVDRSLGLDSNPSQETAPLQPSQSRQRAEPRWNRGVDGSSNAGARGVEPPREVRRRRMRQDG
jgi:cytochrome c-type biogenesis protein CcmH